MKGVFVDDISMAEREGARERGVLNGVKFLQFKSGEFNIIMSCGCSWNETETFFFLCKLTMSVLFFVLFSPPEPSKENEPMDSYFLQTLREICGHMCDMDGVYDVDPMALYGGLLLRLSRSVSEKDALEVITPWLARDELIILPLKRRHHVANSSTTSNTNNNAGKEFKLPQPIDVELFVEAGDVHAKVTMTHEFGLYRKSDLQSKGMNEYRLVEWSKVVAKDASLTSIQSKMLADPAFANIRPWVHVDANVVERINFGSGNNVRFLSVSVPDEKNSGYVRSEVTG